MNLGEVNTEEYSDEELLKRYHETSGPEVIGILYKRYLHLVYGLCLKYLKSREDAQDAVMNIFESLTEKLKHHKVTYFKSWLYMVSKNHCLMELRKSEKIKLINGSYMENEVIMHPTGEKDSIDSDLEALERCLQELRTDQQQCVRLFYLEKKSYQEIVDLQSIKLTKVKSYIQNGKRNLKICLEKHHVKR